MEKTTVIGILIGLAALIGGFLWEGGEITGLFQPTAALIVFGGTIAAVVISFPWSRLRTIPQALGFAFKHQQNDLSQLINDVVNMATTARRNGVLALERMALDHPNDFLREGIQMVVDGTEPEQVKQILELEIDSVEQKYEDYARPFESAGGYAPTMGIIGTVMGLVHVLGSLSDPTQLGPSIAVAFIATLYGVASANIIFLPIASKIKSKGTDQIQKMELLLQGILAVQNAEHPQLVKQKLISFTPLERQKIHVPIGKGGLDETAN